MKDSIRKIYDLVVSWGGVEPQQTQQIMIVLEAADRDTVALARHETLLRKYARARNSLIWSIAGIALTILLGVPGIYFYYRDQIYRERQVATRLQDAERLKDDGHFEGARKLIEISKSIDASSIPVYLAELEIDATEALSRGVISDELLARAELTARESPKSVGLQSNLGQLFFLKGQAQKAVQHMEQAVGLAQQMKSPELLAEASHNLGVLYIDLERGEAALPHISKAADIFCTKKESQEKCSKSLYELARIRFKRGEYPDCLKYLDQARSHLEPGQSSVAPIALLTGECYMASDNLGAAEEALEEARALFRSVANVRGESYSTIVLGQINSRQGDCTYARTLAERSTELARTSGALMTLIQAVGINSEIEQFCKNVREAYILATVAKIAVEKTGNAALIDYARGRAQELASSIPKSDITALDRDAYLRSLELTSAFPE
ncbi:MAG TPA: tetratricopeptide repeat protein [Thermoanaerobaculia bacterium]|jgi:tetratricopeptide (TPR) repeat protein|nr:tetratricopeptide repeat protein [Thermoanaerobaculia bacterium]